MVPLAVTCNRLLPESGRCLQRLRGHTRSTVHQDRFNSAAAALARVRLSGEACCTAAVPLRLLGESGPALGADTAADNASFGRSPVASSGPIPLPACARTLLSPRPAALARRLPAASCLTETARRDGPFCDTAPSEAPSFAVAEAADAHVSGDAHARAGGDWLRRAGICASESAAGASGVCALDSLVLGAASAAARRVRLRSIRGSVVCLKRGAASRDERSIALGPENGFPGGASR